MIIQSGSKLLFIGDSITDCNRALPVGEGISPGAMYNSWGSGYVNLAGGLISAAYPEHKIRIVNMGISGNTVRDLRGRWQSDVLDHKPDWLSIKIGINDVWRQFDSPLQPEMHVSLEEYEKTLEGLVAKTTPHLKGLILMTPYFIEPNPKDAMRAMMDKYGAVVKKIAAQYNAILVDTQAAFDLSLENHHPTDLAWDRVHPNTTGHMIIARTLLKALDFQW